MMTSIILVFLVVAAVVVLLKLSTAKAKATTVGGVVSSPILSDNEREFFHRLQRALPNLYVFPQVAANALLKVQPGTAKKHYHAVRNRFTALNDLFPNKTRSEFMILLMKMGLEALEKPILVEPDVEDPHADNSASVIGELYQLSANKHYRELAEKLNVKLTADLFPTKKA